MYNLCCFVELFESLCRNSLTFLAFLFWIVVILWITGIPEIWTDNLYSKLHKLFLRTITRLFRIILSLLIKTHGNSRSRKFQTSFQFDKVSIRNCFKKVYKEATWTVSFTSWPHWHDWWTFTMEWSIKLFGTGQR